MNQGLEVDTHGAHQTLKYTKAKMCDILTQIAANREDHGHPLDSKVSAVWDCIHLLGLMASRRCQHLPITIRLR